LDDSFEGSLVEDARDGALGPLMAGGAGAGGWLLGPGTAATVALLGAGASGVSQSAGMVDDILQDRPVRDTNFGAMGEGGATALTMAPLAAFRPAIQGLLAMVGFGAGARQASEQFVAGEYASGAATLFMSLLGGLATRSQMAAAVGTGLRVLPAQFNPANYTVRLSAAAAASIGGLGPPFRLTYRGDYTQFARFRTTPKVDYGQLDGLGRPTGISATLTANSIKSGGSEANPNIRPPGFLGGRANQARGHLLGNQLGGSGNDPRNLVTIQQTPANSPTMRGFEGRIRSAAEGGQVIDYTSTPVYNGGELVPRGITMSASGTGGFRLNVSVLNPAAPSSPSGSASFQRFRNLRLIEY
jgi:hypothetical protein